MNDIPVFIRFKNKTCKVKLHTKYHSTTATVNTYKNFIFKMAKWIQKIVNCLVHANLTTNVDQKPNDM